MIKSICFKIIQILNKTGEQKWQKVFSGFYDKADDMDSQFLKKEIRKIYGVMGSFNDLVLFKEEQLCIKENQELDRLKKQLFKEISG